MGGERGGTPERQTVLNLVKPEIFGLPLAINLVTVLCSDRGMSSVGGACVCLKVTNLVVCYDVAYLSAQLHR